jgi:transglutaminase-like putative cysteine protease
MRSLAGWTSVLLVAMMQLTLAWSIDNAEWVPGLWILTPVVIGGVLIGAVLSQMQWMPVLVAHGWSLVIGTATTLYVASRTLVEYEYIDSLWFADASTGERMARVRDWYVDWLGMANANPPVRGTLEADMATLFAAVTLGLLLWLLAYISTWFAVRYLSWPGAVLPAGFALVFNLVSAGDEVYAGFLGFFLLCAFLLAARMHLAARIERWRMARVGHSPDLEFDFLRDGLIVSALVIGLGLMLPGEIETDLMSDLPQRWSSMTEGAENLSSRYFPNLNYPTRGGGNSFGEMMPLTGSIELGTEPVFDARLDPDSERRPRYWRMAVFDTWDGQGWRRTAERFEEGTTLDLAPNWARSVPVTQTIRTLKPETRQLYAAPQPESFDLDVRAEVAGGGQDVLSISSREPLPINQTYQAVSRLSLADGQDLRNSAAAADPDWVTSRYAEVPESLTPRVRELAATITQGAETRYDQALALEGWLRANMEYDETIDDPPQDRDKVDWFLFEQQRGYCDYYSTSFVMMARSLGIPARLAAGYAGGQPAAGDPETLRVWDFDAHTWPEVFFPQHGWQEFEPTAGEPPLDHPEAVAEEDRDRPPADSGPDQQLDDMLPEEDMLPDERPPAAVDAGPQRSVSGRSLPLWPVLIVAAIIGATAIGLRFAWLRPLRDLTTVEGAFARLVRVSSWLGLRPERAETPSEFGSRLGGAIPDARGEITTITEGYVHERFGRRKDQGVAAAVDRAWQHARLLVVRGGFQRMMGTWTRRLGRGPGKRSDDRHQS